METDSEHVSRLCFGAVVVGLLVAASCVAAGSPLVRDLHLVSQSNNGTAHIEWDIDFHRLAMDVGLAFVVTVGMEGQRDNCSHFFTHHQSYNLTGIIFIGGSGAYSCSTLVDAVFCVFLSPVTKQTTTLLMHFDSPKCHRQTSKRLLSDTAIDGKSVTVLYLLFTVQYMTKISVRWPCFLRIEDRSDISLVGPSSCPRHLP